MAAPKTRRNWLSEFDEVDIHCEWNDCSFVGNLTVFINHIWQHICDNLAEHRFVLTHHFPDITRHVQASPGIFSAIDFANSNPCQPERFDNGQNMYPKSLCRCLWANCDHEISLDQEVLYVRHVFFHVYHAKLQSIGQSLVNQRNLTACNLNDKDKNNIRDLVSPVRYTCNWEGCEFVSDNLIEFFGHMHFHSKFAESETNESAPSPANENELQEDTRNSPRSSIDWDDFFPIERSSQKSKIRKNSARATYSPNTNVRSRALYICRWNACGKVLPTPAKLAEHVRTHTGERIVACPNCGVTFTSNSKFLRMLLFYNFSIIYL